MRLLNCNNQGSSLPPSVFYDCSYLSPLSLLVEAGADAHGAQLPAGKAILCWFGHKSEGTVVGLVPCEHVEILPLSLPVVSIRFSCGKTLNPVQDSILWRNYLKQRITRSPWSRYDSVLSPVSLYPQSSILTLSALTKERFHLISRASPTLGVP